MPKYHQLMLPILEFSKNGEEKSAKETREFLEDYFNLTEEERNEKISSGQLRISNRTGWARSSLKQSGLLEETKYAHLRITKLGLELLDSEPERLTRKIILEFLEEQLLINLLKSLFSSLGVKMENLFLLFSSENFLFLPIKLISLFLLE